MYFVPVSELCRNYQLSENPKILTLAQNPRVTVGSSKSRSKDLTFEVGVESYRDKVSNFELKAEITRYTRKFQEKNPAFEFFCFNKKSK